jgi:hypothetical protein
MSDSYYKNQFASLVNYEDKDYKPQIQVKGSESGQTNWLSISHEQLDAIQVLLEQGNKELPNLELQGKAIAKLLNLPKNDNNLFDTIVGEQTHTGLAKTIKRIPEYALFAKELADEV